MDGRRSSTPSGDGRGRSNDIQGSQNRSDSSQRRSLERRQSELADYRNLLHQLRESCHLSDRFVNRMELPDAEGYPIPPRIRILALNTINRTKDMPIMQRRGENQQTIIHAAGGDQDHLTRLLVLYERDRLQDYVDQMAVNGRPAMDQIRVILPWQNALPDRWRSGTATLLLETGLRSIKEETLGLPEAQRLSRQQQWLDAMPAEARLRFAYELGRNDLARRRQTIREHIAEIQELRQMNNTAQMMHEWQQMLRHPYGVSLYRTLAMRVWQRRESDILRTQHEQLLDLVNHGDLHENETIETLNAMMIVNVLQEMDRMETVLSQQL